MKMSDSIKNLATAMYTFRKAVKQPKKDKENPFFKSTYVALEGVQKAIDEALPDGLSYTQALITEDGKVGIATIILHKSGEFIAFEPSYVPVKKNDPQGYGSAETYARRYSLSAAFGISSDVDDDGNAASQGQPKPARGSNPSTSSRKPAPSPKAATKVQTDELKKLMKEVSQHSSQDLKVVAKNSMAKAKVKSFKNISAQDAGYLKKELNTELMEIQQANEKESDAAFAGLDS
ncbi:MAG: ERF family protein [Lentilactobacillus diolivorans]|jgi:hypothetical protein|nr:ERF family protein [Lentilactobacillus diolivorans]